jgi:hypothetical protein
VVGEKEAFSRLGLYLKALENPAIEYVSVKISTIFSQIQPLAFDHTVDILKNRLRELYRSAAAHQFVRHDGSRVNKFVNLDMESNHNLFDLAYAYLVARRNKISDFFSFEMIEGMANHVRRRCGKPDRKWSFRHRLPPGTSSLTPSDI